MAKKKPKPMKMVLPEGYWCPLCKKHVFDAGHIKIHDKERGNAN